MTFVKGAWVEEAQLTILYYTSDHDQNAVIVDRIAAKYDLKPVDKNTSSFCIAGSGDRWYSFFDILDNLVQDI